MYKITLKDLRGWTEEDKEMTGYTPGQIIEDGLVADAAGTVFFEDGVQPTPPWSLGKCPLGHPELSEVSQTFGQDHPITRAAMKYWRYHPTHGFGVDPSGLAGEVDWGYWAIDSDGSVWTPPASLSPRIESELFFAHNSFYEICWNNGEVEVVFRDGTLIFSGLNEVDSIWNQILDCLGYDSPVNLPADLAACYRVGVNPLPTLRQRLKHLPLTVQFGIVGGGHFCAEARSATLVVRLDDETGDVSLELIDYYADDKAWWRIERDEDVVENHRSL